MSDAVLIGTDEYCHHGVAYAVPPESAIPFGKEALAFAREEVVKGFTLQQEGKYRD